MITRFLIFVEMANFIKKVIGGFAAIQTLLCMITQQCLVILIHRA